MKSLEDIIQNTVGGHKVPYNPAHWDEMNEKLDSHFSAAGSSSGFTNAAAVIGASILLGSIGIYFLANSVSSSDLQVSENSTIENHNKDISLINGSTDSENQGDIFNASEEDINKALGENIKQLNANKELVVINNGENTLEFTTNDNELDERQYISKNITVRRNDDHWRNKKNYVDYSGINFTADFSTNKTSICQGLGIAFSAPNYTVPVQYVWNFGDGQSSTVQNPFHKYSKSGKYIASLSVFTVDGELKAKKVLSEAIIVSEKPEARFGLMKIGHFTNDYEFINLSNNANEFSWTINNSPQTIETKKPKITLGKGKHKIDLVAIASNGCTDTTSKEISLSNNYIMSANESFSPNGDGINDSWIPQTLNVIKADFVLKIWNSNGVLVYKTIDYNSPWGGQDSEGKIAKGTYKWEITIDDPNIGEDLYKGTVQLK